MTTLKDDNMNSGSNRKSNHDDNNHSNKNYIESDNLQLITSHTMSTTTPTKSISVRHCTTSRLIQFVQIVQWYRTTYPVTEQVGTAFKLGQRMKHLLTFSMRRAYNRNKKTDSKRATPGGGTPLYKLCRYVPPQSVWFLSRFGPKTGIDFDH